MADRLADDIISLLGQLQTNRSSFESQWVQVSNVAAPEAYSFRRLGTLGMLAGFPKVAAAADRSKYIFDSTAINAVERLSAGIEAIVTPQSDYWHGLELQNLTRSRQTDEEKAWLQDVRNLQFKIRYDADSGFIPAIHTVYRRVVAFGNAFLFAEDADQYTSEAMVHYRYLPLAECHVTTDHQDVVNTFYRYYVLTAQQALGKFREKCPPKVRIAAESTTDSQKEFAFIQCIQPRGDFGLPGQGVHKSRWASFHVFEEDRSIIRESGYFEFPVIDFRWLPEPGMVYGEGPVMKCIADIQSLQQLAKNELTAGEQAVKPTLLMANAGVMNRPTARPGAVILGGMNGQGQRLVEPLFSGQRLDFATMVLEAKRAQVKESMYLTLFQLLVQNPQMTATEALIRAREKGELLGPAGSRFQMSLSRMIAREQGILTRRGLYDPDSDYVRPPSAGDRRIVPSMSSPLDRLRRAQEGEGIMRILEIAAPMAQVDPEVLDEIDAGWTLRELRDILGAPVKMLRAPEEVLERKAAKQQQQSALINAQIAEQLASASKQGSQAIAGMKDSGAI